MSAVGVLASGVAVAAAPPCDVETAYYCASVRADLDRPSGRLLVLDDLRHAYVDLDDPTYLEFSYTQLLGDVADVVRARRASRSTPCTSAAAASRSPATSRPPVPGPTASCSSSTPVSSTLAEDELGLRLGPTLRTVTGDARVNLRDVPDDSADLVVGDAFGGRAVPWHLTTTEFVEDIRRVAARRR